MAHAHAATLSDKFITQSKLGMQDIGFLPISTMLIFSKSFWPTADTDHRININIMSLL